MTDTQTAGAAAGQDVAKPTPDAAPEPTLKELLAQAEQATSSQTQTQPEAGERAAPQSTAPAPSEDASNDDEIREWVRQQREKEMRQNTDKAVSDAVGFLRDADPSLAELPDRVAQGLLYAEAANNDDFARAFAVRQQSPSVWDRALRELATSVAKDIAPQPDAKLTADREAARASVRGTTQTKPDPDDAAKELSKKVSEMGRTEFEEFKRTLKQQ